MVTVDGLAQNARDAVDNYIPGDVISGITSREQLQALVAHFRQARPQAQYSTWGSPMNLVFSWVDDKVLAAEGVAEGGVSAPVLNNK